MLTVPREWREEDGAATGCLLEPRALCACESQLTARQRCVRPQGAFPSVARTLVGAASCAAQAVSMATVVALCRRCCLIECRRLRGGGGVRPF